MMMSLSPTERIIYFMKFNMKNNHIWCECDKNHGAVIWWPNKFLKAPNFVAIRSFCSENLCEYPAMPATSTSECQPKCLHTRAKNVLRRLSFSLMLTLSFVIICQTNWKSETRKRIRVLTTANFRVFFFLCARVFCIFGPKMICQRKCTTTSPNCKSKDFTYSYVMIAMETSIWTNLNDFSNFS